MPSNFFMHMHSNLHQIYIIVNESKLPHSQNLSGVLLAMYILGQTRVYFCDTSHGGRARMQRDMYTSKDFTLS